MIPRRGFTLAEVLIALALLGIIAAFAIPKVLESTGSTRQKAIYREGYGELSKILTQSYLEGTWTGNADPVIRANLNLLKIDTPYLASDGIMTYIYTLPNGAVLIYRDSNIEGLRIDYNGNEPPNQDLQDRITFWANLGSTPFCGLAPGAINAVDPAICPQFTLSTITNQEYKDYFIKMVVN